MSPTLRSTAVFLAWVLSAVAPISVHAQGLPSIRRVEVLRGSGQVEIEIEATDRVVPQTHLIANPDRLVVDFVNVKPGPQLRGQAINRGDVKNLRVGLFSADPPVTRLVLDLDSPQPYQVFPSGRTVIVKVGAAVAGAEGSGAGSAKPAAYRTTPATVTSGPVLLNAKYPAGAAPATSTRSAARPPLEVSFQDGLLTISSNKASLSEVLFAVHQRTGAEIAIPAGAEQEQVVVDLGPAPAADVLAHLLNGSKFNFMILSSSKDPHILDQVILSPRGEGSIPAPQIQAQGQPEPEDQDEAEAQSSPAPQAGPPPSPSASAPIPPSAPPDTKPSNGDVPD